MTAVDTLAEAIDELVTEAGGGAGALSDGESVVALFRQLARLEAVVAETTGSFAGSGEWGLDGSQNPTAWLAARCHLRKADARRHLARSRHLPHLPAARQAWEAGEVTGAHIDVLCHLDRQRTDDALRRDEAFLSDQARRLRFDDFTRVVAYWEQFADPDGSEEAAEARRSRRDVTLTQSAFGTWLGTVTLDPISGTIVADELDRLESQCFEADCADAEARLGRRPQLHELARTPAQRRADALVEMATRSATASDDVACPRPLVTVLVDYETMAGRICQLANGTVVTPGSLLPYLDEALVERIVFTPATRAEVSATARFFTGATRRAIEVRDRRCQHPSCDRPAALCQVDHIIPVAEGGPTIQQNGRLLCRFHNDLRNRMDDEAWEQTPGRRWGDDEGERSPPPG